MHRQPHPPRAERHRHVDQGEGEGEALVGGLLRDLVADAVDPRELGRVVVGAVFGERLLGGLEALAVEVGVGDRLGRQTGGEEGEPNPFDAINFGLLSYGKRKAGKKLNYSTNGWATEDDDISLVLFVCDAPNPDPVDVEENCDLEDQRSLGTIHFH